MKKFRNALCLVLALALTMGLSIQASASEEIPFYHLIATGTKSCPYGTITGKTYCYSDNSGHGANHKLNAETSINSSYNMDLVETSVEAMYEDTGLPGPGTWSASSTSRDSKTDSTGTHIAVDFDRVIRVYSAHQVVYTDAYTLYLSGTIPASYEP